ncbi:hypothetical protein RJ640_002119 [Escallonia rubra]|uniref:F-box domain-containing protein n=1 Tax=Escallonia rubra TaxID=112253 RepID=A0AA88QAZ6_9ASTE|nr:hypothetical protein RJ640_002119 [Escallonia rubra]
MNEAQKQRRKPADISQIPVEIVLDILSRLPAKTLLTLKCVSKPWCSFIRDPVLVDLRFSRAISGGPDNFALFISAYNHSTSERHFLSASLHDGAATTHLLTLPKSGSDPAESEHINGLVLFRRRNGLSDPNSFAYICNPSTRQILKLPKVASIDTSVPYIAYYCYNLFGFDPIANEHKVLNIVIPRAYGLDGKATCKIFSFKTFKWRKVEAVLPFDAIGANLSFWQSDEVGDVRPQVGVCVSGVLHWMLKFVDGIMAFDLKEEKFSVIPLPPDALPANYLATHGIFVSVNHPYLIQIDGVLALVCCERFAKRKIIEVWMLEDYGKQVWVKETITFQDRWTKKGTPYPMDVIYTGEVLLRPHTISGNRMRVPLYDRKKKSFRFVEITLAPEWLSQIDVEYGCARGYAESILSLRKKDLMMPAQRSDEPVTLAYNGGVVAATNGIHLPVGVVIVDDVNESPSAPGHSLC